MSNEQEQTYESYAAEAAEIYSRIESLELYVAEAAKINELLESSYALDPNCPAIEQLEAQWRYARQRAEDLYAAVSADLDAKRLLV